MTAFQTEGHLTKNVSHEAFLLLRSKLLQSVWVICGSAFQADDAGLIPAARFFLNRGFWCWPKWIGPDLLRDLFTDLEWGFPLV